VAAKSRPIKVFVHQWHSDLRSAAGGFALGGACAGRQQL